MRIHRATRLLFFVSAICCAMQAGATSGAQPESSPFDRASLVPSDVDLYLHVENAADLRRELAQRPLARWLHAMLGSGEVAVAWSQLAQAVGIESSALFDLCFGQSATFVMRTREGESEWAIHTSVPADKSIQLLRQLRLRTLRPRHQAVLYESPEHRLLVARRGNELFVSALDRPDLLFALLSEPAADQPAAALDGIDMMERARALGPGPVGMLMRHDPPLGGWSTAVVKVVGDDLTVRHQAKFDTPPFSREVTGIEIDLSLLRAFQDQALLAVVEPMDIGSGPFEAFLLATLGEGLLSPAMRENLGDRRIFVFGEIEGRMETEPVDLQATTIAVCMELQDLDGAAAELDAQMVRLSRRLRDLGGGRYDFKIPDRGSFEDAERRMIDISPASEWFTGSLPIVKPVSLNWSVISGPHGAYYVVASHPSELNEAARALQREQVNGHDAIRGRFQNSGIANGVRISHHLRSWSERPDLFVDDEQKVEFQQTLALMSALAEGIGRATWQLSRPSRDTMSLEIEIRLAPPESAPER